MTVTGEVPSLEVLSPAEIATAITMAGPPLDFDPGYSMDLHYLTSNDGFTGVAYQRAAQMRPEPTTGMHAATMIVGHGSFETAMAHLPDDEVVMFCDKDPWVLFTQRVHVELVNRHDNLRSFMKAEREFFAWLESNLFGTPTGVFMATEYLTTRMQSWNMAVQDSTYDGQHFLTDQYRYQEVRDAMQKKHFAFYQIDFLNPDELDNLGAVLRRNRCEIAEANLTNVLNINHAGTAADNLFTALPWNELAAIISSLFTGGAMKAEVDYLDSFRQRQKAHFRKQLARR